MILLAMLAAIVVELLVPVVAAERMIRPSTVTLVTDVLLLPLMVIVLVRGDGMRGKSYETLVAVAGGGGLGSICVARHVPSAGAAATASAAVRHQRSRAGNG